MASPSQSTLPTERTILFRSSKKRKIYRSRAEASPEPTSSAQPAAAPTAQSLDELITTSSASAGAEDVPVSMAEILRLRKARNKRGGGVEFRTEYQAHRSGEDSHELVVRGEEERNNAGVVDRFARQTGMLGDVDRHMMAYIDSQLAKRHETTTADHSNSTTLPASAGGNNPATTITTTLVPSGNARDHSDVPRQPAALGKLQEIDLGSEARDRNVRRTVQATRRLQGEEVIDEEEEGKKKEKKVRLGPDGKPWRGKRKRRGSEDVKRDIAVERVLEENRLDLYTPSTPPLASTTNPNDNNDMTANDDRIAEAFRREFMDAAVRRQQQTSNKSASNASGATGGKKEEEALKGPKLGGSRTARAAMREQLLKEQRAKR